MNRMDSAPTPMSVARRVLLFVSLTSIWGIPALAQEAPRWLAGDHHIHSWYSMILDRTTDPPTPIRGSHGFYPIPMNALMAKHHGLSWLVATDHGGPNHSKITAEQVYPELVLSREVVPEVVQFYGMELNTPAADHSSVIIPHTHDERERLFQLESGFDKRDAFPPDPTRDTEEKMIEALKLMSEFPDKPVVIANHPSRTNAAAGVYGLDAPSELRAWNDAAPDVAVGMAGAPGHQANALNPDGSLDERASRGQYANAYTFGGFDEMTGRLGGFWDSMLGEGRHWWITANSDSHHHWTDGGNDFWPGEYSKTYVYARKNHDDILAALRAGRVFVTTGDLISELDVTAVADGGRESIMGETLEFQSGDDVLVTIRVRDPDAANANEDLPAVNRIDLIVGDVTAKYDDLDLDINPTTYVLRRFTSRDWKQDGEFLTITHELQNVSKPMYLRVRGTNTDQLEPEPDPRGEDPWGDLWFYSNPIFLEPQ